MSSKTKTIALGHTYEDVPTGFVGVAVGIARYICGSSQVQLAAKSEGGNPGATSWFEIHRVTEVEGTDPKVLDSYYE